MFRKIVNIILVFLLFITTTGFTMSKHYCSNKLVSLSIDSETEPCCDMGEGCCLNETDLHQLNADFLILASSFDFEDDFSFDLHLLSSNLYDINTCENISRMPVFISESSPPLNRNTVLAKFQSYLL